MGGRFLKSTGAGVRVLELAGYGLLLVALVLALPPFPRQAAATHNSSGCSDVFGTNDGENLIGNDNCNDLWGRDGADTIHGRGGQDDVHGENGHDFAEGEADHDNVYGGEGNDNLAGRAGNDHLQDGQGTDVDEMCGEDGTDFIDTRDNDPNDSHWISTGGDTSPSDDGDAEGGFGWCPF